MSTIPLTLDEIFDLAKKTLLANGCDDEGIPIYVKYLIAIYLV